MRVYGALMWSLGKVLNTPEVMRVYIGYVLSLCFFSFFLFKSYLLFRLPCHHLPHFICFCLFLLFYPCDSFLSSYCKIFLLCMYNFCQLWNVNPNAQPKMFYLFSVFAMSFKLCLHFSQLYILSSLVLCSSCSSFNDKPINEETASQMFCELFEKEQNDLLMDLVDIPKKACDRRVCGFCSFLLILTCIFGCDFHCFVHEANGYPCLCITCSLNIGICHILGQL